MPQSAKCCYPLQVIVLLVHEGDRQPALTDAKGLRCYHSLEVVNCGATLGGRAFLGGAHGNIYEVVMQAKTVELVGRAGEGQLKHHRVCSRAWDRDEGLPFHQPGAV